MMLFDDTEIFSQGSGGRRIFDVPDADLLLIDNFFNKEQSYHYYNFLLHTTQWRAYEMPPCMTSGHCPAHDCMAPSY